MEPTLLLILFCSLILFNFIFSAILDYINDKNWKNEIPNELKDFYDKEKYLKAKDYKKSRGKVSLISSILSTSLTLLILATGIYGYVSDYIYEIYDSSFLHSATFFLFFYLINMIISIPISYYSTFVVEEKFGFNKSSKKTFFLDKLKGLLMTAIIGGFILSIIIWFYQFTGNIFWLFAWGLVTIFTLFMNMFYSKLIVPLFNKQTPLENGELKDAITKYVNSVGFRLNNIFIINGSKRSTKANAYFSGFGSQKRITLYDTLINDLHTEEIVAVLAHEVGHYKKKHIIFNLISSILITGLTLFILSLFIHNPLLSEALGVSTPSFHIG